MAYTITTSEWDDKIDRNFAAEIKGYKKNLPTPMRPVGDRVIIERTHFVIMEANTTPCNKFRRRGKRIALIEVAEPHILPTRIDKRLKSIRQILAVREVFNLNHHKGIFILCRYVQELRELMEKCERLWPCHFLVKGIDYVPPKTFMAVCDLQKTEG